MYKLKLALKTQKTIQNNLKHPRGAFRIQASQKKNLRENSQRPRAVNSFHKKALPPILNQTLNTPWLIYCIKIKTGTSQSAERLHAHWGLFSAKFKAIANEIHPEKNPAKVLRRHSAHW